MRVKHFPELKIYFISTQTLKFYLPHVILNDSSCQWNWRQFNRNKQAVNINYAQDHSQDE